MDIRSTLRELSAAQPAPRVPDHTLLRCIGRGSYGEVWLARTALDTYRAVKVVYRSTFEDSRPYEREYTGIRKYEPVSRAHEGLVDILHVGRNDEDGYFYYVMELADAMGMAAPESDIACPGESFPPTESYVPRTLSAERRCQGRLPASECIVLGVSLCGALVELHRRGLIHRDIKPSNIIFVGGVAKLADIGLVTDAAESGSYVGTEGFIPPEGPNSPQADIFGLGKVLYEVSMGKDRLDFPEPATALDEMPDRDRLIELNAVLLSACQPERRLRYVSAEAMQVDLEWLQRGKSVREKRASERRLRWMKLAAVGLCAITLIALGVDRVLEYRTSAMQGRSSPLDPSLIGKVSTRDLATPGELIDLTFAYTAALTERWYPGPKENTLSALPQGLQTMAGTRFDVRGLVQLSGGEIASYGATGYPSAIRNIPIERWARKLHFLHGAVSEASEGAAIGSYRVYFNTTRAIDIPILYGQNIRALWQSVSTDGGVTNATVAWSGQNPGTKVRGLELRVYQFTWDNPWPAEQIVAVDFSSAGGNAAPFLIALTAELASLPIEQRRVSVNLVKTMQQAAHSFPRVPILAGAQPFQWSSLKLNANPAEIGGRFYDGFRFTAPDKDEGDLVWSFSARGSPFQGWFILPMTGGLKVGFEDWYLAVPKIAAPEPTTPSDFKLQFLSGKKLQPGREYFIWFGSDARTAIDLQAALRFVVPGQADPNAPDSLIRSLGLPLDVPHVYQHHYCLGAIH